MEISLTIQDQSPNRSFFSLIPLYLGAFLLSFTAACGGGGGGGSSRPPVVTTIEVSPSTATLSRTGSLEFSATARDADGTIISNVTFTWSSDNPNVLSIDSDGFASGLAEGIATITASAGGISGTATVEVTIRLFSGPTSYPVGNTPSAVTTGDFNGDGFVDLAVANADDAKISLLNGTGNGLFSAAQTFETGIRPESLVAGRFDNDLFDDLAVASFGDTLRTISIFLGASDGIGPGAGVSMSSGPIAIVAADFNSDGNQDLATANLSSNDLSIMFGGNFQSPVSVSAGGNGPIALLGADLNKDGKTDLVVALGSENKVAVLLNDGTGGFSDPPLPLFDVGDGPNSVISGDWDGDGKLDLAVVNSGSADLTLLFGDGAGGFSPQAWPLAGGGRPEFAATGDFDDNGSPDIAVSNSANDTLSILLNIGGGLFSDPIQQSTGDRPLAIAVRDLNGDTKDDLAVTHAGENTLSIFFQVDPN